jgi:hypothetical protein
MANYVISGAGTTAVNGTYTPDDQIYGHDSWSMGTSYSIYAYGDNYWLIGEYNSRGLNPGMAIYYSYNDPLGTPDTVAAGNGWTGSGDQPFPTVTLDEGGGSNTIRSFVVVT